MDQLALLRNADLPDGTVVQQPAGAQRSGQLLPSVAAGERVVCVCLSARLLYPAAGVRLQTASGSARIHSLGIQQLLLHHHRSRTHLESDSTRLPAADDCGHSARIQGQIPVGIRGDSHIHRTRNTCQPCADDILLHVHHSIHGTRLPRGSHTEKTARTVRQGYGGVHSRRNPGRGDKPQQPVPHMAVCQGVDARQERTREKELCQPDFERTRPRLHNTMELRHRRDMDPARAQHQGRSVGTIGTKRESHGESRPAVLRDLPAAGTVLGQSAGYKRSRLCGSLRADALHFGSVHRERPHEVGTVRRHSTLDTALMGTQLHVVHRPLPRLCAHVCQVPHGGIHPRHSRIHHPAACDDGAEEDS